MFGSVIVILRSGLKRERIALLKLELAVFCVYIGSCFRTLLAVKRYRP
jgi:hypothetical protein